MDWVKLATRYYLDPAVVALPDADAEMLFVRGLAYAGAEATGGFIHRNVVSSLSRRRRYEASAEAVVACGLWLPSNGGYQIARWEEWQAELDALARRRSADRDRKRRKRAQEREEAAQTTLVPPSERRDLHVRGQSADTPVDSLSSLRTTTGGIEKREFPPYPPPGDRTACTRHRRRRSGCADCAAPARTRNDSRSVTEALGRDGCPHGAPPGTACALCRRGIPAEEVS